MGPWAEPLFSSQYGRVIAHTWMSVDERMKERMVEKHPGS